MIKNSLIYFVIVSMFCLCSIGFGQDSLKFGIFSNKADSAIWDLGEIETEIVNPFGTYSFKDRDTSIETENLCIDNVLYINELLENKKYKKVERELDNALVRYPYCAHIYNKFGLYYQNILNDYETSLEWFYTAIGLSPDVFVYYLHLGRSYYNLNELEVAYIIFSEAIDVDSSVFLSYYLRGLCADELDYDDAALEDYLISIELNDKFIEGYEKVYTLYNELEEYDKAIEYSSKALKIDPLIGEAYFQRGIAYLKKGDKDNACKNFNSADAVGLKVDKKYFEGCSK